MIVETRRFDVAESLNSEERIAAYLEEMFSDGDPKMMARALGDVARARGISEIARKMGVSRETVYQSFSAEGNPRLTTLVGVAKAMGFELHMRPAAQEGEKVKPVATKKTVAAKKVAPVKKAAGAAKKAPRSKKPVVAKRTVKTVRRRSSKSAEAEPQTGGRHATVA